MWSRKASCGLTANSANSMSGPPLARGSTGSQPIVPWIWSAAGNGDRGRPAHCVQAAARAQPEERTRGGTRGLRPAAFRAYARGPVLPVDAGRAAGSRPAPPRPFTSRPDGGLRESRHRNLGSARAARDAAGSDADPPRPNTTYVIGVRNWGQVRISGSRCCALPINRTWPQLFFG